MCQKVRIAQFSGIFPFILSKCLWKWPKMWKILLFKTALFGFCIYLVNLLLKENRSRDFSKTWLPKVSKWVLLLKNQVFTYPMMIRTKKWCLIGVFRMFKSMLQYTFFGWLKRGKLGGIWWNISLQNGQKYVNSWFIVNRTHLDTFGSQVFEKSYDRFSFSNRFTK